MISDDVSFFELSHRGVLILSGDDHRSFLQGLVSVDIRTVTEKKSLWTGFLTPQGKFLHEFFVYLHENSLLLEGEKDRLDDLRTRLLRYRLRAKVTLEHAPERVVFGILPSFHTRMDALPEAGAMIPFTGGTASMDPRLSAGGIRVVTIRQAMPDAALQITDLTAWEQNRIRHGLPDGSRDIEPEKGFLLEYGFDELKGVDFRKGCYVGQETTARMKWKNLVKKRMVPLRARGTVSLEGSDITLPDGQSVGTVRSCVQDETGDGLLMLGMVRLDALRTEDLRCSGIPLTPCLPGWIQIPQSRNSGQF